MDLDEEGQECSSMAGTINISQKQKIIDLATEFQLIGAKPIACPLPASMDLCVIKQTPTQHATLQGGMA